MMLEMGREYSRSLRMCSALSNLPSKRSQTRPRARCNRASRGSHADAALAEFGDIGHRGLVVVGFDALPNLDDKVAVKAFIGDFVDGIALIDQQK